MFFEPTKRAAVHVLQKTREGEALLLVTYLFGEEHAEGSALAEVAARAAPQWLHTRIEKHRADERRHAALLRQQLERLGVREPQVARLDPLSALKLRRIRARVDGFAPRFEHGHLVTLLAAAQVLEQMAERVFARHVAALPADHALRAPLARILADERKHVRLCADSLSKLVVSSAERAALDELLEGIRRDEQSFRLTGAVLLLFAGVALWLKARLASSISPSPTPAAT